MKIPAISFIPECAWCQELIFALLKLTGKDRPATRDNTIEDFRDKPEIRVMIASLRAGGTGLSLTMARKCILIDLWWNEAIEQQVKNNFRRF